MKLHTIAVLASLTGFVVHTAVPMEGRERSPAVVNPVLPSPLRETINLAGTWDFVMVPNGVGEDEQWYRPDAPWPNKETIQVPGCWEAQGKGGPGDSRSFTPERQTRPLRGSYYGTAWYRKEVPIPGGWEGKHIWLEIGGVHAQGWFWVNGTFVTHDAVYCGTYKYNITDLVKPGAKAVVVAKVRNDVTSFKGLVGWMHRFGGLYRTVEIEATPEVSIDYAYVDGGGSLFDEKKARVHVTLRSFGEASCEVSVVASVLEGPKRKLSAAKAGQASKQVSLHGAGMKTITIDLELNPFHEWAPEDPNLYQAEIVVKRNGKAIDGWLERFGARKWEVRGGNFYLNNRKYFVRGFGDDWIYPQTICSPPDRDVHQEHLGLAKDFGFVYVRKHTHTEIPEYYEAADELGIMIQPELPYYGSRPSGAEGAILRPKEDLRELITHYRRHVSLSTYCTGNEGHLGSPLDKEVYQLGRQLDPTRLFLHQDGGHNTPENSDFRTGPVTIWRPGAMDDSRPFFAHEYLNLAIDRDPRLALKYTGGQLPPVPVAPFLRELKESGLSMKWGTDILESGRYLQRLYQKLGLESARIDAVCDGYIYWTIADVDYSADQGLLDPFWHIKITTPRFFRQFNGPTAILASRESAPLSADQRILAEGDEVEVDWSISHFDRRPISNATLRWRLEASHAVLQAGEIPGVSAEVGDVKIVGTATLTVPSLEKAAKARFIGELAGTDVSNSWDVWLFPKHKPSAGAGNNLTASENIYSALSKRYPGIGKTTPPSGVLLTDVLDGQALAALEEGKSVILLKLTGPRPGVRLGWWATSAQTGTAVADHAAFGDFPHDGYLNHLFFRLVRATVKTTDPAFRGVEKLMVNHGNQGYLTHVFQAKAGNGKILASGLDLLSDNPESVYLLDQFIKYVQSPLFQPEGVLDIGQVQAKLEAEAALMKDLNGWSETVRQFHRTSYGSFLGMLTMNVARFSRGETEVVWQTQPVPTDIARTKDFQFKWIAGLGWITEPPAAFQLTLGNRELVKFGVVQEDKSWKSTDGKITLKYTCVEVAGVDSSGTMELTLPATMLQPGEKTELSVVAPQTGSRRWFGLYEYP